MHFRFLHVFFCFLRFLDVILGESKLGTVKLIEKLLSFLKKMLVHCMFKSPIKI